MTEPDSLVTEEGVDEGSAASTVETAAHEESGVLGEPPRGAPDGEAGPAGPVDMEGDEAREARAERGPGQQLQEGEG